MQPAASARLPGIRFEAQPRPLAEALPRMDVAAFVGFARTGPLNIPVPVEEAEQFHAIFGSDLRLAWDRAAGRWVHAFLAPAVRAFFANGGDRCWVIRVAGDEARGNRFPLQGLYRVSSLPGGGGSATPAYAAARSRGSWSDPLRVSTRLRSRPARVESAQTAAGATLELRVAASPPPAAGDLLRVVAGNPLRTVYIPVIAATRRPGEHRVVITTDKAILIPGEPEQVPAGAIGAPEPALFDAASTADILSFDLRVAWPDGAGEQLDGLGFAPGHPRFWSALANDDEFYGAAAPGEGGGELAGSRFSLAGSAEDRDGFFIPWKMPADFVAGTGPEAQTALPLERDGLAAFSDALFLDPELRSASALTLMDLADYLRYRSPQPRRLRGIHGALGWNDSAIGEEVTMIAVPDAVHRPWERAPADDPRWFERPAGGKPPLPDAFPFHECKASPLPSLSWDGPDFADHPRSFRLRWSIPGAPDAALGFRLEESATADFAVADSTILTPETDATIFGREPGEYFYRVRAELGARQGPWSVTLTVQLPQDRQYQVADAADAAPLLSVHRALLRMCGAHGGLLAVLALPAHYRDEQALRHALSLTQQGLQAESPLAPRPDALAAASDSRLLSHGALYHPWISVALPAGGFREIPPDGIALGILARRTLARGAWVPPANEPLSEAVALAPAIAPQRWLELQEARVNLLRREPQGFIILSADTLSPDRDLKPIHVRRLLILLRRLALRVGNELVFEANDQALRSLAEQRFEGLLERLYRRGAFAGAKAADSFRVSAGADVNSRGSLDAGRLLVELRVRPAQALRLLTVRLIQSGSSFSVSEVL